MSDISKRPLIGIITASACQSEQRQILDGIIRQARHLGADTAIFSNIYNSSEYFANIDAENEIYDLIISQKLDGLILTAESFLNPQLQQTIYQKLLCRQDIPVVVTGAVLPGFPCIDNDIEADFCQITDHLVQVHGFHQIDILTGPKDNESANLRVQGYAQSLAAHGIPFVPERVIYGDYWMTSGEALARDYIAGKRPMPQAVVCCNDYMAYGLCDTLALSGVSIPADITVIGYEYVGERFYHAPILTTYQRNRQGVGASAVNRLWSMMYKTQLQPISTKGFLVPGNSCACGADDPQVLKELRTIRQEQYYTQLNLTGNFEQQLTLCSSIQGYIRALQDFSFLIREVKGVYLCLREDWCQSQVSAISSGDWDPELMVCYRIISPEQMDNTETLFRKPDLYPDTIVHTEQGSVLYFCPVFFSGKTLGYIILQYDQPDGYDIIFREWLKIASNALEMLRMKNDITTLLACRDLSQLHDSVTGLYNETGLIHELEHALQTAGPEDQVVWIQIRSALFPDQVNLKNRKEQVQADMAIAKQLQQAVAGEKKFCAKLNDTLYVFVAVGNYSQRHSDLLADKLKTIIQQVSLQQGQLALEPLIVCQHRVCARDFELEPAIQAGRAEIRQKISQLAEKKRNHHYGAYLALRNKIYLEPQKEWDAQKLCYEFCLSRGRFRSAYKEIFAISFHQDIIQSRIALAKYLLITTKMKIASIASRCGYEDDKHFMHQFKQATGLSPNLYRKSDAGH